MKIGEVTGFLLLVWALLIGFSTILLVAQQDVTYILMMLAMGFTLTFPHLIMGRKK